MGRVYTPDAIARAIVWAADHGVRELTVGGPALKARVANALAPGWFDQKLANDGYEGQMTDESIDPRTWRDNVDHPLDDDRDYGAEGAFSDQAEEDLHLRVPGHGSIIGAAALVAAAAGVAAIRVAKRFSHPSGGRRR